MADVEIDDEPIVKTRRRSIFNRTSNENVTANCTRLDLSEIEDQVIDEHIDELKQEIESWKQLLTESRNKNAYLKGKLRTDLKDYADIDLLNEEEKNFIKSTPDYSSYVNNIRNSCIKAEIVALKKEIYDKCNRENLLKMKAEIDRMSYELTSIL